jgi:diguanylate cyclase (GGDEF)-like protein
VAVEPTDAGGSAAPPAGFRGGRSLAEVSLEGVRILVAEDSAVQATLTCEALRHAGCSVRLEGDGRAALTALDEERFELLVTDWMMPGCDGIQLCRSLRAREESAGRLYILFLTTLEAKEQIVEALSAGADDYLVKPFDPGELLARVRAGLRLVRLQDQLRSANSVLSKLALTDPLTGLSNRRAFDDLLRVEASAFARRGVACSLARVDVDRFKSVNDAHGHDVGDQVLVGLARAMREAVRDEDLAARIGGDEFALLFRACGLDEAVTICERVRDRIARAATEIQPTVSMGVAEMHEGMSAQETLAVADEALYAAKRQGGNAVVAAAAVRLR